MQNDTRYIPTYGGTNFRDIAFTYSLDEYNAVAKMFRSYFCKSKPVQRINVRKMFNLSHGY